MFALHFIIEISNFVWEFMDNNMFVLVEMLKQQQYSTSKN